MLINAEPCSSPLNMAGCGRKLYVWEYTTIAQVRRSSQETIEGGGKRI
jgi:hypothetical protein